MDINDFRSFTSVLVAVTFLFIFLWTLSPRRKKSFDEAARNPLEEDALIERSEVTKEKTK